MNRWESLVEKKIREAMEEGEFDNLPGKGKPVDTTENPFEDPELRMAHRLLRNAGFAPPWMEERKEIDVGLERALTILGRAWDLRQQALLVDESSAEASWQRNVAEFRDKVAVLNRRIQEYNLQVPAAVFERRKIDCEHEIRRFDSRST